MNLVAGATGILGGEICRRLLNYGKPVRALVRSTSDRSKVEVLERSGAEFVTGDFKDPSSLAPACEGVSTVISGVTAVIPQEGDSIAAVDEQGHMALIDAAKGASVRHFIFISYSRSLSTPCSLTNAKRAVENRLRESKLTYTILRPAMFMETWLSATVGYDLPGGKVQVVGTGDQRLSFISLGDVAEVAARCVDNAEAENRIIELGGPDAVSPLEVARIAQEFSGAKIDIERIPAEAVQQQRAAASNPTEESFATLMLDALGGDEIDMSTTLERFPIELTSVRQYVGTVLEGHHPHPPEKG